MSALARLQVAGLAGEPVSDRRERCSCGEAGVHEVARRWTLDRKRVVFWSDGLVTFALGFHIAGVGSSQSRWARDRDREANAVLLEEVCLFSGAELSDLARMARKHARKDRATTDSIRRAVMALHTEQGQ